MVLIDWQTSTAVQKFWQKAQAVVMSCYSYHFAAYQTTQTNKSVTKKKREKIKGLERTVMYKIFQFQETAVWFPFREISFEIETWDHQAPVVQSTFPIPVVYTRIRCPWWRFPKTTEGQIYVFINHKICIWGPLCPAQHMSTISSDRLVKSRSKKPKWRKGNKLYTKNTTKCELSI